MSDQILRKQPLDINNNVVIAEYNLVLPTYLSGQVTTPQTDNHGRFIFVGSGGAVAVTSDLTGFFNSISYGVFNTTRTTRANGQSGPLETNDKGALLVARDDLGGGESLVNQVQGVITKPVATGEYSPTFSPIYGTDVDVSLKTSPGNIMSVYVKNLNASKRYFQIHNKASAPANPDVPVQSFEIPAGGYLFLGKDILGDNGAYLSIGVAYGISTTEATFTAATTTDHSSIVGWI